VRTATGRKPAPEAYAARDVFELNPPPMRAISVSDLPCHPTLRQLVARVCDQFECTEEERAEIARLAIADPLWSSLSFRTMLGLLD
jgi:hypothetical protein